MYFYLTIFLVKLHCIREPSLHTTASASRWTDAGFIYSRRRRRNNSDNMRKESIALCHVILTPSMNKFGVCPCTLQKNNNTCQWTNNISVCFKKQKLIALADCFNDSIVSNVLQSGRSHFTIQTAWVGTAHGKYFPLLHIQRHLANAACRQNLPHTGERNLSVQRRVSCAS